MTGQPDYSQGHCPLISPEACDAVTFRVSSLGVDRLGAMALEFTWRGDFSSLEL